MTENDDRIPPATLQWIKANFVSIPQPNGHPQSSDNGAETTAHQWLTENTPTTVADFIIMANQQGLTFPEQDTPEEFLVSAHIGQSIHLNLTQGVILSPSEPSINRHNKS